MKTLITIALLARLLVPCEARVSIRWTNESLMAKADLAILAIPIAVKDTGEKTSFAILKSRRQTGGEPPTQYILVPAVRMETTFKVLTTLKGENETKKIVLHHLREIEKSKVTPNGKIILYSGGPNLVSFDPKGNKQYRLFLKRESDGHFTPVSGQTDPADSISHWGYFHSEDLLDGDAEQGDLLR